MKKLFYFVLNITWIAIFIIGLQSLVWHVWHFNVISGKAWSDLGQAWQDGEFVIDNGPKLLFALILLFSPFLLLLSIWLINKINFVKIFEKKPKAVIEKPKKKKTEEEILKELEANPTTTLDIRPHAVGQLPQEVGEISQEKKQQPKPKQEEKATEKLVEEKTVDEPVAEKVIAEKIAEKDKEQERQKEQEKQSPELVHKAIFAELQEKGYTILNDVTLGDNIIDFLAIAKKRIILIGIDEEAGNWTANEEEEARYNRTTQINRQGNWTANEEEEASDGDDTKHPEWFSVSSKRESPVNMIMESYVTLYPLLKEALGNDDFPINVVLVISCSNIVNIKEIQPVWADIGASVVRHKNSADNVPKSLEMFSGVLPNEKSNPASDERIEKIKGALAQDAN